MEKWIALALKDGYRDRVQLIWQCCAHLRDYKTAMQQFEATLGLLKTDRMEELGTGAVARGSTGKNPRITVFENQFAHPWT